MNWIDAVVVVNLIMVICGPIGAYIAIKSSVGSQGQVISDRVQKMMQTENELLETRLKRYESRESLTVDMLKSQYHIDLSFDGNAIILRDNSSTHVARIKED